jgi:CheY-like chemotaxis protein
MSRTILVADDSPTIRKIVELTFTDTDIRVEVADSGSAALDRIDALQPDLVLADVFMPDPTGYDLCRTIKASERPVPVVLLAGTFEPFDSDLARDCGADAHLVKPFESEVLLDKVRTLLEPPIEPELEETEPLDGATMAEQVLAVVSEDDEVEIAVTTDEPVEEAAEPGPEAVSLPITQEFVDAVAEAVAQRISSDVVREIAAELVPQLASEIIRERIRELEQQELDEEIED